MKYILGLFAEIGLTLILVFLFVFQKSTDVAEVTQNFAPQITEAPIVNALPTQTPETTITKTGLGTISGKLCYPSQFLPVGAIEAKNTLTNQLTSQNYPGSENGGTTNFSIEVPSGTYILRYKTIPDQMNPNNYLYGYFTDVCPTGLETTCAQENARQNKEVIVTANAEVKNVNLCDFYYNPQTPPSF